VSDMWTECWGVFSSGHYRPRRVWVPARPAVKWGRDAGGAEYARCKVDAHCKIDARGVSGFEFRVPSSAFLLLWLLTLEPGTWILACGARGQFRAPKLPPQAGGFTRPRACPQSKADLRKCLAVRNFSSEAHRSVPGDGSWVSARKCDFTGGARQNPGEIDARCNLDARGLVMRAGRAAAALWQPK
jgi:hypothetical protein